jgi:hypothetical protein
VQTRYGIDFEWDLLCIINSTSANQPKLVATISALERGGPKRIHAIVQVNSEAPNGQDELRSLTLQTHGGYVTVSGSADSRGRAFVSTMMDSPTVGGWLGAAPLLAFIKHHFAPYQCVLRYAALSSTVLLYPNPSRQVGLSRKIACNCNLLDARGSYSSIHQTTP